MQKTKIALSGASGKMGRSVIELVNRSAYKEKFEIVTELDSNYKSTELNEGLEAADLLIDFSSANFLPILLPALKKAAKPAVIATTGLTKTHYDLIEGCAETAPMLCAANTSIGANLTAWISAKMTQYIPDFDIEIIETHHKYKKDAPSGTALMIGNEIAKAQNTSLANLANFTRQSANAAKGENEIGFSSVRSGGVYGRHEVIFANDNETIAIAHNALNRRLFASGSIAAARWLLNQKPGLYSMHDFLNIS